MMWITQFRIVECTCMLLSTILSDLIICFYDEGIKSE